MGREGQEGSDVKRLKIEFERGGEFAAKLLDAAPNTGQLMWKHLPFEGVVRHAILSGYEVWFPIPNLPKGKRPRENFTRILQRGDIGYLSEEWMWRQQSAKTGEAFEGEDGFCIYYGLALPRDFRGDEVVCVFARITENLEALVEVGRRIHMKGAERVKVTRTQ
jgi:hypothetical protein